MKVKEFNNKLTKVNDIQAKIDSLLKEKDSILLSLTSSFKKGENITYLDKNDTQQKGKILYNVGQKSLTVITPANTKVNIPLNRVILA